jgi:hypothetical protein
MLQAIWVVCLAFFAVSLVALAGLLLMRYRRRRREQREKALHARLSRLIVVWLHEPDVDVAELREAAHAFPRRTSELLAHAVELLQGDEQARLVGLVQVLGLQAFMLRELVEGKSGERQKAAEKLAFFDSDEVVLGLFSVLEDRDPQLSLAAARSLAALGRDIPAQILRNAPWGDSVLVHDLFEKLAVRQSEDLVALARDMNVMPRRRVAAVEALGSTGDFALISVFSALALESTSDVRAAAARGLGRLGHPKAQDILAGLFGDDDYHVRAAAVWAVGQIQLTELYAGVGRLLDDAEWWVRLAAAEALAVGGDPGLRVLRGAEAGGSVNARDIASMALLEHGGVSA